MCMKEKINPKKLPEHVAVIMDGNGRWAQKRGAMRIFGHENAVIAVRETVEAAAELGIKYLTLYTFSTENWKRPKTEVDALMNLLVKTINNETKTLIENNIRLIAIGDLTSLQKDCYNELMNTINITSANSRMTLILALSYSARWEITEAVKQIAQQVKNNQLDVNDINQHTISSTLSTKDIPDPSLLIRTSGEYRISNFLLWQLAYTELYFSPVLWPDFRKNDLYNAIIDFQKRERRFGMTSEQIK
ncbi:MAG TPA: isoprenyl transferase [Bacteroidales bacterium]|nr:isoprenyl transferase [Bacteroidales bacterium]HQN17114.1 isoprenyl transferase [Bacteroidales bacterium]